jgi:CheY-like chemotaxis protein
MVREGRRLHLRAIAENQANTLNLFLSERIVNLSNLFNDPKFPAAPTSADMDGYLIRLQRSSPAFVDIGFFDSSGVQTLEAARTGKFDLALLDLKMPGMDGTEVLRYLKQEHKYLEVIILTGHGSLDSGWNAPSWERSAICPNRTNSTIC